MPQQCCHLLHTPLPLCGVCVVRGHFAFASCGILRTSCRLSRHAKTCPRSSPTTPPLLLLLLLRFCVISCRRRRHKVLPAHTHIALQLFCISACGNLRQKWLHFTFFLSFLTCHIQHPQRQQHTQPTWPGNPHQET